MPASSTPYADPPSLRKSDVLVLWGFGVKLRVEHSHLVAEWGVGLDRYSVRLSRVDFGAKKIRRVVCISTDGYVTLSALEFLAQVDASFVLLERSGHVHIATGMQGTSDARLRRAQACLSPAVAMRIAKELVDRKLAGQAVVAREQLLNPEAAAVIEHFRLRVWRSAETPGRLRYYESMAASSYWQALESQLVTFQRKDLKKIPSHWQTWGPRLSPIAIRSPRAAISCAHACENYLYSVLESEARIAVATLGLDELGVLHADSAGLRPGLSLDLIEPCRHLVDRWLLEFFATNEMEKNWFYEMPNGCVRLASSLCIRLAETAPLWQKAVGPIAEWFVLEVWKSIPSRASLPRPATRLTGSSMRTAKTKTA